MLSQIYELFSTYATSVRSRLLFDARYAVGLELTVIVALVAIYDTVE